MTAVSNQGTTGKGENNTTVNTTGDVKNNTRHSRYTQHEEQQGDSHQLHGDDPEMLIQMFLEVTTRIWGQIKYAMSVVMTDMGGYRIIEKIAQWSVQNPQLSLCVFVGILIMFLPALIITGFGISTLVMTFTGFLILEGTLLTIVSMLLFGCLVALIMVLICLAFVLVTAYSGFAHVYELFGSSKQNNCAIELSAKQGLECGHVEASCNK